MQAALYAFAETREPAERLAAALDIPFHEVSLHRFPDGESLVRVEPPPPVALLYRSLDDPNAKLVELLLAASALEENGADRVMLVAPYLAYMRQDMAFEPGQAVSQRIIGELLASRFDGVLTIDPHLHRIHALDEVMPGTDAISVTAAPVLSRVLEGEGSPVLVGPDSESRQWVEGIARPSGLDVLVGSKQRAGDRQVTVEIPNIDLVAGRDAIMVDDVISSGMTLQETARLLRSAGARSVQAIATHCLASEADIACLHEAGIETIRSCDTVPGATATIPVAGLLAEVIREKKWLEGGQ